MFIYLLSATIQKYLPICVYIHIYLVIYRLLRFFFTDPSITSSAQLILILIRYVYFCSRRAGEEDPATGMRLHVVRRDQHGFGEKDRRILQAAIPGGVHSVQRTVLAILFAQLKAQRKKGNKFRKTKKLHHDLPNLPAPHAGSVFYIRVTYVCTHLRRGEKIYF